MLKNSLFNNILEAGIDEVGRGCLAGSVVAAAVILPPDYKHNLLNDSKQLTKKQRDVLKNDIIKDAISWSIAEVDNREIDKINILQATFKSMHLAIEKLSPLPEHLLIDGNRFLPFPFISHTCIVKGDSKYLSIAAASVLAKTYRDKQLQILSSQYPQYGWESNMGYPTLKHRQAILNFGFTPYHRLTFKVKE